MSINHRAEALRLAEESHSVLRPNDEGPCEADRLLAEAQLHATLAHNEEQTARTADMRDAITLLRRREYATREAVSQHIANALASRAPDRWKAGLDLTKALDEADCNVDDLVDARLSDDGWDPRSAYKSPASAIRRDDPWATTPDVTAEVPEPVRRVLAKHLADMLLDPDGEAVQTRARNLAFALKNEGADLTPDIEARIRDLTLGRDPSEPPF